MITEIAAWDEETEIAMFEISYYLGGRVFRFQQLQHRAKNLKCICRNVSLAINQRQRCDMPQFNGSKGNEKPYSKYMIFRPHRDIPHRKHYALLA